MKLGRPLTLQLSFLAASGIWLVLTHGPSAEALLTGAMVGVLGTAFLALRIWTLRGRPPGPAAFLMVISTFTRLGLIGLGAYYLSPLTVSTALFYLGGLFFSQGLFYGPIVSRKG